jgi:DNA-directed RNA polymerase subunit RPC12/RpoP
MAEKPEMTEMKDEEWECEHCGEVFATKPECDQHEEKCKDDEWECEHCGKVLKNKFECDEHEAGCGWKLKLV